MFSCLRASLVRLPVIVMVMVMVMVMVGLARDSTSTELFQVAPGEFCFQPEAP
jgi:hypothetical protein